MKKINLQSKINELDIPHIRIVLEEIFLIPPAHLSFHPQNYPATVLDLIQESHFSKDLVLQKLRETQRLAIGVMITVEDYMATKETGTTIDLQPSNPHKIWDMDFNSFISEQKSKNPQEPIFVLAAESELAFSAAMQLRVASLLKTFAVEI